MVGFARNAVMSVADKVIEAVKTGRIRHFFLVAGCDGAQPGINFYTEFVEKLPQDSIILTLACGKFRFFDKNLGNIAGIPRLLNIGQCSEEIQVKSAISEINNFMKSAGLSNHWKEKRMKQHDNGIDLAMAVKGFSARHSRCGSRE